jgi:gliding motility-associated-like protein
VEQDFLTNPVRTFSRIYFNFRTALKNKSHILFLLSCLISTATIAQSLQPVEFIENKGQWDSRVMFKASVPGGSLFVHQNGYTVLQHKEEDLKQVQEMIHHRDESSEQDKNFVIHSHAYRVDFEGASPNAKIIADKTQPGVLNYYYGNDQSKWASNCKIYLGITVKNIYPNIDLRYYSGSGSMKYDIIVNPGGKVKDITLAFNGAEGLAVANRMLEIKTSVGTVRELDPYSYQYSDNGKRVIKNGFRVKGNKVSFDIRDYDESKTLVIDPTMVFASFTGSKANNWGFTATYGPDGSMFGGGIAFGDKYPVTTGAAQTTFAGDFDIALMRLSSNGSTLMYGTYLGGNGEDQPHSLMSDAQGNLFIAGRTNSTTTPFPLMPAGSTIGSNGLFDIVVTMLGPTGNLLSSKRIGGGQDDGVNITSSRGRNSLQYNYGDDGRSEIMIDNAGNIYVASSTRSTVFPGTGNAPQKVLKGNQDGVILKFSPNVGSLIAASYFGGSGDDAAYVVSVDPANGNVYFAGGTASNNLPGLDANSLSSSYGGSIDGFVTMFNPDLSGIIRTTYIGTGSYDQVYGVKMDKFGYPYVMGQTADDNWPHINANFFQGKGKQFIAKLKPDLSGYVYSTAFGSGASEPNISPVAFLVDRCENVYVSGWGGVIGSFTSAGTNGLTSTPDAYIPRNYSASRQTDGKDFYFFVLKRNATQQLYGSFYGQDGGLADHVDGGTSRFDEDGVIYQGMCANCDPTTPKFFFPTTSGAYAQTNGSGQCNMAMIKIAFNLAGLNSGVQSAINGELRDSAGCVPLTVDFRDSISNAVTYEWDLDGDGVTDRITTAPNTSYTYMAVRNYRVRLIAVDSNSCNIRDTSFLTIRVGDVQALPDFSFEKLMPCTSITYRFTNTTIEPPIKPFRDSSFAWDFGDGSPLVMANGGQVTHAFPAPGSYRVRLYIRDTAYCNAPDYKDTILNISTNVKAIIDPIPDGCAPYTVSAKNASAGGQQFTWDFGDPASGAGNFSSLSTPPPHTYVTPGTYTIRLKAVDSSTCNIVDSTSLTIRIFSKPVAGIGTITPQPPTVNTPITFTNTSSSDATNFRWVFGDGESLNTPSRSPVSHEFNETKTYTVLLIAINENGCRDTASRQVDALIEAAIDVPNAFTPTSGDVNSLVFARGFGIAKLKFTIYNRWGQKVFETENRKEGWDGKYKGVLQPMDVYGYTLEVEFVDGKKATRRGDITLIR